MHLGLVLSGGAAYGLANIGVLEALEEQNIRPDCIAGSSMGSIVAAVYALGHSVETLKKLASGIRMFQLASISESPLKNGLHGGILRPRLKEALLPLIGSACIGDCEIPFVCIAGRVRQPLAWHKILTGGFTGHVLDRIEPHVFSKNTSVMDAIMASSAIPVVFSPVNIGEDTYVDMVHFGAIPARTLQETHHPNVLIATDTTPVHESLEPYLPVSWQEFLREGYKELQKSKDACDLVLYPKLKGSAARFDLGNQFVASGYDETMKHMDEIHALLQ